MNLQSVTDNKKILELTKEVNKIIENNKNNKT